MTSRGSSWWCPHVAIITSRIRSASASPSSAWTSTPAVRAAASARSHASRPIAPASLCGRHGRNGPRGARPRVPSNRLQQAGRSAAFGRRQLLPLALLDALAATTLEERGDRGDDAGEEHEEEELLLPAPLLLAVL